MSDARAYGVVVPVRARNRFAVVREPTPVRDGVMQLGSQRVNFYVITEGRSMTLVDCGFRGHWRYLDAWLSSTGRSVSDIEAVVLTHGHADHVGFAPDLAASGIPIYLHHADVEFATKRSYNRPPPRLRRRLWRPRALSLFAEAATDGVLRQPPLLNPTPVQDGDVLDVPGGLKVVHVPGHNPGSCALYASASAALFSGDALMTLDPMFGTRGAVVFAEDDRHDVDAMAGLDALTSFRDAALLPAHGEVWDDPGSVGRAIDEAVISTP